MMKGSDRNSSATIKGDLFGFAHWPSIREPEGEAR